MRILILFILSTFLSLPVTAQLKYYSADVMEGYTLFLGDRLFLVDNCGEVVNSWNPVSPKYHVKLLPNGNIIFIDWLFNAIVERDWDDNLVKSITPSDPHIDLDYEVIVLENGNYLCVGRKEISTEELVDIGYNLSGIGSPPHTDVVLEMDSESGEVVWLWNSADHVIQQRSSNLPNYGVVSEHPELLNLDAISTIDWMNDEAFMINGMDYNADLDQIVLSLRKMSEVVIIDHSTTTEEASGHSGGLYGKGGDILYRWGNPQNYDRGDASDRTLYFQHNPNWIQYGEHIDKIAIYNNGIYRPGVSFEDQYSNAPIIATPILENGNYELGEDVAYGPIVPEVDYGIPGSDNHFFSYYTSATKVLPNGNVLITVGGDHRIIELKPDGSLAWEYTLASAFFTFRAEKYPPDYAAFDGRDLTPMGTIEFPPSTVTCQPVSIDELTIDRSFVSWTNSNYIYFNSPIETDFSVEVLNELGQRIMYLDSKSHMYEEGNSLFSFPIQNHQHGLLFIVLKDKSSSRQLVSKLFLR